MLVDCREYEEERRVLRKAVEGKVWRWLRSSLLEDEEVEIEFTRIEKKTIGNNKGRKENIT